MDNSVYINTYNSYFADIDECALPGIMSNCSFNSVCVNRPGGFDCPCKRGMTGDGKRGTCTENFPPAAKAAVGKLVGTHLNLDLTNNKSSTCSFIG